MAVRGEAYKPTASKLKDVNLLEYKCVGCRQWQTSKLKCDVCDLVIPEAAKSRGLVQICWDAVKVSRPGFSDRPGKGAKWTDMCVSDIEKLREYNERGRFTHILCGIGLSGARPMVSASCCYNQAKALIGRVFRQPELRSWGRGPMPGVWEWAWQFVDELLPEYRAHRMTVEEWLKTMPATRRRPLERAYERYKRVGWTKSYRKFSSFVKTELLPGFAKSGGDLVRLAEMLDRLIQGPSDECHVITGPWLKPLVKELKKKWTSDFYVHYGSCGPESLHRFLVDRVVDSAHSFFWCDFSMYDNTHSDDSWTFMERLYSRAGIEDCDFWQVLKAWKRPEGRIGPMRYRARVMNASGRDDTALANGILNGFATYLSVSAAYLGKPLLELTVADLREIRSVIALSVCGDDSLGCLPPMPAERLSAITREVRTNIAMFGFEAKLECSTRIHDAVYLGMRPYPTKSGWFWGKTIGRSTYKMGWKTLSGGVLSADPMAHITGVADMHTLCSRHVPVLGDIARKVVELRCGAKRTPVNLDPNKPWEWTFQAGVDYDEVTLQHVAEVYSTHTLVTTDDIRSLLEQIKNVNSLPCILDHWVWRRMVEADDL